MKTLDEVIKALELCMSDSSCHKDCPYYEEDCVNHGFEKDALHYLKEYRDKAHRLDIGIAEHSRSFEQLGVEIARYQEAVKNCEEAESKYRKMEDELNDIRREHIKQIGNDPLTWDDLKQMEGKPVWIEFLNDEGEWNGEWCLVESSNNILCEILRCKMNLWGLRKITHGKTWQAYRKERS